MSTLDLTNRKYQLVRIVDGRTVTKDNIIYKHADYNKMTNRLDYLSAHEKGWCFRVVDLGYEVPWNE